VSQVNTLQGFLATQGKELASSKNHTENSTILSQVVTEAALAPAEMLAASAAPAVPSWCQYVPVSLHGAACRGSSIGCACQSFCNGQKDANNPECCGCGDSSTGVQQKAGSAPVSQAYKLQGSPTSLQQRQSSMENSTISALPPAEVETLAAWHASAAHVGGTRGGATVVHAGGAQPHWHHGSATIIHTGGSGGSATYTSGSSSSGGGGTATSSSGSSSSGGSAGGEITSGGSSATYSSGSGGGEVYGGSSGGTVVHTGSTVVHTGGATAVHHGSAAGGMTAAHHSGPHGSATVVHRR